MSMLTPVGEGGRRRRGARRTAITLLLAVLLLAGATYVAWDTLTGDRGARTLSGAEKTPCPAARATGARKGPKVKPVRPGAVRVNVYNSTSRPGLAGSVAAQLEERGFRVLRVANDPTDRTVRVVAEIRHGRRGRAAAVTLRARAPGAVLVRDPRRTPVVDLALGTRYRELASEREALTALRAGRSARNGC